LQGATSHAETAAALFFLRLRRPPGPTLFPYTTLFRSMARRAQEEAGGGAALSRQERHPRAVLGRVERARDRELEPRDALGGFAQDRKSTRLNSSHDQISYAVFCLKKKTAHPPASRAAT